MDDTPSQELAAIERVLFDALLTTAPVGFCLLDLDLRFVIVNDRLAEINGLPVSAHIGKTVREVVPNMEEEARRALKSILATGEPVVGHEFSGETAKAPGKLRFWSASWYPVLGRTGNIGNIAVIVHEITVHKRTEQALRQSEEKVRRLASELGVSEMRERRQIAQDLHDDLGQMLAAMQIRLSELCKHERDDVRVIANDVASLLSGAIRSTRSLAAQLVPPVLYRLGLVEALGWLSEELERNLGLDVTVEDDGQPKPLSQDARSIVYRAARELLINVAKHAKVKTATIQTQRRNGALIVTVLDRGCGFDSGPDDADAHGFGLASIRERMAFIGGSLKIQSGLGVGSKVTLTVPLSDDEGRSLEDSCTH